MKKFLKTAVSFLLAALITTTSLPQGGFTIEAGAESVISFDIEYDYYGTAFVEVELNNSDYEIRYTLDGSIPTLNSLVYTNPIQVYEETLVRAAAFDENGKRVKGIKKTVKPKLAPVTFKVRQDDNSAKATITLDCITEGSEIYYTTDGSAPDKNSTLYEEPIVINSRTKIRVRAYADGYASTTSYSKTVDVNYVDETEADTISYKFTYNAEKGYTYVTFTKSKSSNVIYYTTDGSSPTKSDGKKYSKRVKFTEPGVIRAREYTKSGEFVASVKVNVKIKCAPVEFYATELSEGIITVGMRCDTPGVDIYFTTDGSTPDADNGKLYSQPIVLGMKTDLMAVAVKSGYRNSSTTADIAGCVPLELQDFDFNNPIYREVADYINMLRTANGGSYLVLDEALTEAANVRAVELSVNYDNIRPTGVSYSTVISEYGVDADFSTEFICTYYKNPVDLIKDITGDKVNYNLLLGNAYKYNKIGIGCYESGKSRFWSIIVAM